VRRRGPGQSLTARRGAPRSVAEASAGTLREMNPLVRVAVRPGRPGDPPDAALLADVDVAVLTGASHALELAWDAACRGAGVAFYAAACRGSAAYLFADLREHAFTPTVRVRPSTQGGPLCVPGHAAARPWSAAFLFAAYRLARQQHAHTFALMPAAAQRTVRHRGQTVGCCAFVVVARKVAQPHGSEVDSLHSTGQGVRRAAGRGGGGELQLPAAGGGAAPAVEGAAPAAHPPPLLRP
jgi:hypothetical protein